MGWVLVGWVLVGWVLVGWVLVGWVLVDGALATWTRRCWSAGRRVVGGRIVSVQRQRIAGGSGRVKPGGGHMRTAARLLLVHVGQTLALFGLSVGFVQLLTFGQIADGRFAEGQPVFVVDGR